MRVIIFSIVVIFSYSALGYGFTVRCGHFKMVADVGQVSKINGETVTFQKITELGDNGLKVDMTLMPASDGNNYGFEYVHRPDSEIRFLNVQLLQANMDIPPIIGSFPCKKISG